MGRPTNAERIDREAAGLPAEHSDELDERNPNVELKRLPKITYVPEGEGAPHETVWNRHRFRANVPVSVRDVAGGHTAAQMVELAKTNPQFLVEGFPQARSVSAVPDTPERYRSYAVGWIRMSNVSSQMLKRWKDEAELRDECGIAEEDVEYLQTIFNPRLAILKDSEKLAAAAVND